MKFDETMLIVCIAVLVVSTVVRFAYPPAIAVLGFDNIMFLTGMLSTMTLMHMVGYYEGLKEGLKNGKTTMH